MKNMNAVYRNRLLRLAKFLRTLPDCRFDFKEWVGRDWDGKPDLSCGTTACALGWAAAMPEFRALGFGIEVYGDRGWVNFVHDGNRVGPDGFAGLLFDLSSKEHRFLFYSGNVNSKEEWSPGDDATASEVAEHILRFVKDRRANAKYTVRLKNKNAPV